MCHIIDKRESGHVVDSLCELRVILLIIDLFTKINLLVMLNDSELDIDWECKFVIDFFICHDTAKELTWLIKSDVITD